MTRRSLPALAALLLFALPAAGQDPLEEGRSAQLRQLIEERFASRVQEELGLTDAETERMRATSGDYFRKRRDLEAQERRLKGALAGQLRPGVAANQDSVAKLLDQLLNLRVAYVQSFREEMNEMSAYLSPVQRAQFFILRDRLMQRIEQIRDERQSRDGLRRRR